MAMILIIYMGFLRIMVLHESAELCKLAQGWIENYRLVDNGEQNGSGQQEPEYGEKGKTVFWSRHHFFIYFPHGSSFLEGVSDGSGVPLEWLLKVAARLQESEKGVQWVYYPDKEKPEAVYAVLALSLPPNAGAGWLLVGERRYRLLVAFGAVPKQFVFACGNVGSAGRNRRPFLFSARHRSHSGSL